MTRRSQSVAFTTAVATTSLADEVEAEQERGREPERTVRALLARRLWRDQVGDQKLDHLQADREEDRRRGGGSATVRPRWGSRVETNNQRPKFTKAIAAVAAAPPLPDAARAALASAETAKKPTSTARSSNVAPRVGLGAAARRSVQTSRWTTISARSRLLVTQTRTGTPMRSAYQCAGLLGGARDR